MPSIQARTVLVKHIPGKPDPSIPRSKKEVEERFNRLFPGQIAENGIHVVEKDYGVSGKVSEYCPEKAALERMTKSLSDASLEDMNGKEAEREAQADVCKKMEEEIKEAMIQYNNLVPDGRQLTQNAFITFKDKKFREMAVNMHFTKQTDQYVISPEPCAPPEDILFAQLMLPDAEQKRYTLLGWTLIGGLFFFFLPIVLLWQTSLTEFIHTYLAGTPVEHVVGGFLPAYGFNFMLGWFPTFCTWIMAPCFDYQSKTEMQLLLQKIYWWLLVVYVLLAVCVGANFEDFITTIASRPFSVFELLANRMPLATHFYLNYMMLQPFTHGMNLCRYMSGFHYFRRTRIGGMMPEDARFIGEPEAQCYYGIGSRSARFALMLLMGITFGTICPLMYPIVWWTFLSMRTVYGYLIPCAEGVKTNDSGGLHFQEQLLSIQHHLWWYMILMIGILMHRPQSSGPSLLAFFSIVIWTIRYTSFRALRCESLSVEVLADCEEKDENEEESAWYEDQPHKSSLDSSVELAGALSLYPGDENGKGDGKTLKPLTYSQRLDELFMKDCSNNATLEKGGIPETTIEAWMAEFRKGSMPLPPE